eukprot:TRINITY_DN4083_c1_g1_i1.p1 TRINITY_DN4083_c1_g1~~TRINITY_DN4083_c1_g1_i1.p1  ORF type:complete len:360 (+),score=37.39 TRINITY_DN4083_c1_g1_i1:781-1860(+)
MTEKPTIKVIEFYSGIGGARVGVEKWAAGSGNCTIKTVASFDMNDQANKVYRRVFNQATTSKGIEHLKLQEIQKLTADMWLLSPPCQPFTLGGGRGDTAGDSDNRCKSFSHLTKILNDLPADSKPKWIIIENVPQFSDSDAIANFKAVLDSSSYNYQGVTTSPESVGVPYQRKRFYLLCSRVSAIQDFNKKYATGEERVPSVGCFLKSRGIDITAGHSDKNLVVTPSVFESHPTFLFDIVSEDSASCSCFTKGYGKNYKGSGSLLLLPSDTHSVKRSKQETEQRFVSGNDILSSKLRLRYFSPEELLVLHGFPPSFTFPDGMTVIQKYRLIGNSLSCDVHQILAQCLLEGTATQTQPDS